MKLLAPSLLFTVAIGSFLVSPSTPARAAAEELVAGVTREFVTVPFSAGGRTHQLEAMMVRATARGIYPLAIISHGSPRSADDRPNMTPSSSTAIAIEFARRGYATLVLMRRGYGESDGTYAEGYGSCESPDYESAGRVSAQDIRAGIRYVSDRAAQLSRSGASIDASRVLLVGVSAGGFGSIASAAERLPGIVGVINFAGGRGSQGDDDVCDEQRLVKAFGSYGRTAVVPTVWLYAANDHFFGPALARRMFSAFQASGGKGDLIISPAFGTDGHGQFSENGMPNWRRDVDRFLRAHALPTWETPVAERAPRLQPPSGLSEKGRDDFQRYLASTNFNKAFAVTSRGGYAWRTGQRTSDDAREAALDACATNNSGCRIYAIDNRLASASGR